MSLPPGGCYRFEDFELNCARWVLRHGNETLALNRKTFDLLLHLVANAERVVTKEELLRVLWPAQFVEESNLTQQVFLLRKALGRYSTTKIVETVSGRGYRFAVPVRFEPPGPLQEPLPRESPGTELSTEAGGEQGHAPAPDPTLQPAQARIVHEDQHKGRLGNAPVLWTGALLLIGLTLALLVQVRSRGQVSITSYTQLTRDGHAKALGGTDGSRLYFTRLDKSSLEEISVSGKAEATIPLALKDPWSGAVSPDGSTLSILSQGSGQGPATSLWTLQLVGGSLHRLANAVSSAWSPDGEHLAYTSADGELAIMRRDGSEARPLLSVGGNLSSVAWSPDGELLRYSRDGVLWQVSSHGGTATQVLPGWGRAPTQWSGEWAPSGDYFFVADGQIWMLARENRLFRRKTPQPIQLTSGPMLWDRPIVGRDGSKIYASGRTSRGELVRFDPTSPEPKPFLAGTSAEFVSFSKAADAMAYVSYPDGILWRANLDGSSPHQLTEPPLYPKSLCWSPDGSRLAFVDRTGDRASAIWILASDGMGGSHLLIAQDTAPETDPSWSPDGHKIVFSTAPNVGASGRSELRVFDLPSNTTANLPGSDGLLVPRWSPDGRFIAAMTLDAKGMKILNLATGQWSPLVTGAVAFPEWSLDSKSITYVRWTAESTLMRIRVADGAEKVLADLKGSRYTGVYTLWMGLDAAGTPMMLRDAGTDDIYALTLQRK